MKIGILLPSSRLYPSLMFDFMAGYQAYFKSKGIAEYLYVVEMINTGGDYKLLQQKAQTLLLNSEVKIIVAFIDLYAAKQIEPFINAAGKILISCEPGSVIPGIEVPSPNHIAFSLQCAYAITLSVNKALQNKHTKNFYFTSFYDGGYTHCYSAARAWEKQNVPILANFITPFGTEEWQMEVLLHKINELQPDSIILQNCAEAATHLLKKCKEVDIPTSIPIYASPFMLEESWIEEQPFYFENMSAYVAWHSDLVTKENTEFCATILNEGGKKATIFHLLGWESAMLVKSAVDVMQTNTLPAIQIVNEVTKKSFTSPRGNFIWQKDYRHFVAPMYETKLINNNNFYKSELTGEKSDDMSKWIDFASDVPIGVTSRWFNMYLCPT